MGNKNQENNADESAVDILHRKNDIEFKQVDFIK
jgi:hypothetical protein